MHFIEPLESVVWFGAIDSLAARCRQPGGDIEGQLRHAYHLLQMAPLPLREVIEPACDEAGFEQFLACQAFESAALALVPPPLKFSAARGYDTVTLATVAFPGDDTGNFASSENFASAVLQAWVRSIKALEPKKADRPAGESVRETDNANWPWVQVDGPRKTAGL